MAGFLFLTLRKVRPTFATLPLRLAWIALELFELLCLDARRESELQQVHVVRRGRGLHHRSHLVLRAGRHGAARSTRRAAAGVAIRVAGRSCHRSRCRSLQVLMRVVRR